MYYELFITGVPVKVPDLNITNSTDGGVISFTLRWGEPFNNYDPIIMYHVSCSGDAPCPQNYNTTNNHTKSHTFTGFTPNSYYTFSVVAINSIGSGEAGIVMIGEIINATIAPSVATSIGKGMITITSSEGMTTTTSSESMTTTTTSSEGMTASISSESKTTTTSSEGMINSC